MSKRLKLLIGVNIVLLALITLSLRQSQLHSTLNIDNQAFAVLDTGMVSKIELGGNVLQRKSASEWELNGQYAVQPERMQGLLALLRQVEIKRVAPNNALKQVLDSLGRNPLLLKAYSGNELLQNWSLASIDGESYAKRADLDVIYALYVPGYRLNLHEWLSEPTEAWRDRRVLHATFASLQSMSVEKDGKKLLSVAFDQNFYRVEGVQKLDSVGLYNYLVQYSAYRADAYLPQLKKSHEIFQKTPFCTISVTDMADGGQPKVLQVFVHNDSIYGWASATDEAVLLPKNTIERLVIPFQAFEKKE